jgi:hypothetical protein
MFPQSPEGSPWLALAKKHGWRVLRGENAFWIEFGGHQCESCKTHNSPCYRQAFGRECLRCLGKERKCSLVKEEKAIRFALDLERCEACHTSSRRCDTLISWSSRLVRSCIACHTGQVKCVWKSTDFEFLGTTLYIDRVSRFSPTADDVDVNWQATSKEAGSACREGPDESKYSTSFEGMLQTWRSDTPDKDVPDPISTPEGTPGAHHLSMSRRDAVRKANWRQALLDDPRWVEVKGKACKLCLPRNNRKAKKLARPCLFLVEEGRKRCYNCVKGGKTCVVVDEDLPQSV